ncbi:hypothetical protein ACWD7M_17015 [Streptomyces griseus]
MRILRFGEQIPAREATIRDTKTYETKGGSTIAADHRLNGGAPTRRILPPAPKQPVRPQRRFTDADHRRQREIANDPRATWDQEYEIPARPWDLAIEAYCEAVRLELEAAEHEAEQHLRSPL